jgi:LCP family protein required for cell wall assembly
MSGTSVNDFFSRQASEAQGPVHERSEQRGPGRSKLVKRLALGSALTLVVLAGVVAGGGYLVVNHLASSVYRIHGIVALDAANQPVMPVATRQSTTVLLTSSGLVPGEPGPGGRPSTSPAPLSGLIALVHLNASGRAGAVVSIPATAVVSIPGHGRTELWNALRIGGPSLLIRTVERLTDVRIEHYSVLDFPGVRNVIGAMNGVDVDVPYTVVSLGHVFHAGINRLTASDVLAYARQPLVSQVTRTELQQNLIRAIMSKIAAKRMFVGTDWRVLRALTRTLSVDSSFSNSQLESLALKLGHLRATDSTFITAPTVRGSRGAVRLTGLNRQLWQAIRHDAVAAFAQRYPSTVTPDAPG